MKIERPCATNKHCSISKIFDTMSFFMMPHFFRGWQQRKSQKKFFEPSYCYRFSSINSENIGS